MKYIFPLQFRLVNVFTLDSGGRNNIDEWKGNMFRENEISLLEDKMHVRRSKPEPESADTVRDERRIKVPKRLRGTITELVRKLRNRNAQCSYGKLLRYYCPTEVRHFSYCPKLCS